MAWSVGLTAIAATVAAVAESVVDLVESEPRLRMILAAAGGQRDPVSAFFAMALGMLGFLAAAQAIQAVLRLQVEEDAGRTELVLATAVGRGRWAAAHLVFAAAGPALALAAAGAAAAMIHGLHSGGSLSLPALVVGALVRLPAVWTFAGLALALHGLAPRFTSFAWGAPVAFLLLGQLGPLLPLSPWILALSPFAHVPELPGGEVSLAPLAALVAVAAALAVAGLGGLLRRDIGA
jgi:ABC-2 type transport system permease protein